MDRFIGNIHTNLNCNGPNLKSNMDRFIELDFGMTALFMKYLKSNMDRFIGYSFSLLIFNKCKFKIQYG